MQITRFPQIECVAKLKNTDTCIVQETEKHWIESTTLIALNCHFSRLELPNEMTTMKIIKLS